MTVRSRWMMFWVMWSAAIAVAAAVAALNFGRARVVYRPAPPPAVQHTTAGLVGADEAWWKAQLALDARTSRYPTWLLGYRIEPGTSTVDNYLAGVATGGRAAFYSSVTVRFRWGGSRWVQQGSVSVQPLGSTPAAYAQFSPLP